MIATLLPILISILADAPQVISSVEQIWALINQNETPTADQQAAYDAALDTAHQALQAS